MKTYKNNTSKWNIWRVWRYQGYRYIDVL